MHVDIPSPPRLTQLLWRFGPLLLWMIIIFVTSSQSQLPAAPGALIDKTFKKFGHISAYAMLMWLILRAMTPAKHLSARQNIAAFAILMTYAASDEFHQSFVSGRTATWMDVFFFDGLGGWGGWVVFQRFRLHQFKRHNAWFYWLLFIGCTALLLILNLPYDGKVEQEPTRLLSDYWFLWGFNYFGLLLMPLALLLYEDARARQMRAWVYVIPYFVVGALALSVYLARRASPATFVKPVRSLRIPRWLWLSLLPIAVLISAWLLPQGSWPALRTTMHYNVGLWFMWLDIALNHILAIPLVYSDMVRRGQPPRRLWLLLIALTGPLGLAIYMARRSGTLTISQ